MIVKLKALNVDNMEMLFHLNFIEHSFEITQLGAGVTRIGWYTGGKHVAVELWTDSMEFFE